MQSLAALSLPTACCSAAILRALSSSGHSQGPGLSLQHTLPLLLGQGPSTHLGALGQLQIPLWGSSEWHGADSWASVCIHVLSHPTR